jgi:predicted metal-dependent hydrolase
VSVFATGVSHFNRGEFFEAHEAFEDRLEEVEEDARWEVLLALVQVAVGYHKAQSGHAGAARMLGLGLEKLDLLPAAVWGVDVESLRRRVREDLRAVATGGSLANRLARTPPRIDLR